MRVLMVGVGDIARKAYLPVLSARPDVELHLATRNRAVLEDAGRTFRVADRYTSVAEALSATTFDAAFVHAATPAHPELVRTLLEHDVPTFVDKPLADNIADAEALVALALRRDTPIMAGFNRRFAPDYVALRTVDADLFIMEKHRHGQPDLPRRVVFDDFIHVVDTLLFLTPAPVLRRTIETHVERGLLHAVTLTLAGDGFTSIGTMHRDSGLDEERLDAIGRGARRTVLNLSDRVDAAGTQRHHRRGDWTPVGRQRGFEAMCDAFLDMARERRPADAAAILQTHELCEAIVRHTQSSSVAGRAASTESPGR
ncbi:Gfo/Idh/MocA family protein [Sphingomonas sp. CFBP 13720]|uniref:Gfo/Idh/MocA family protein n=1 Tax=Sphingomonas sp. CFBP 13720 TaxID=2775302 RepID=UPI00177F0FA1|nr:Gfo/Idh/MocA family oxidoreductase [Sphingomonas sp. CFBP 13720]MBD8678655.1 Gfo/Idh/MocA family oxidoreductase [Sphingomonas sp. CFBP 13720]